MVLIKQDKNINKQFGYNNRTAAGNDGMKIIF